MAPPSDSPGPDSVIARYLEGDEDAFRALLEAQEPALRARIGRRMAPLLRRRVSIQDVFQEVSLVAFERRAAFTGRTRSDFNRWIRTIADRCAQGQVNRHARTRKRALDDEISHADGGEAARARSPLPSPSQHAMGAEMDRLTAEALEGLPPDYHEVLRLCREEGASLREVAARMGRSYAAVKKLHGRAMVQFVKEIEKLQRGEHD